MTTKEYYKSILHDIGCFTLFPRWVSPTSFTDFDERQRYWSRMRKREGAIAKKVGGTYYHWWIITYEDGKEELAYLTQKKGLVKRGIIFRRRIPYWAIKDIRIAF